MYITAILVLKNSSDPLSLAIVIFLSLFCLVITAVIFKNADILEEDDCIDRYGTVYDGKRLTNSRNKAMWIHPLYFFIRRIVFAMITVYLLDYPAL